MDQSLGTSTPGCSKITSPLLLVMRASRVSHSNSSKGWRFSWVKNRWNVNPFFGLDCRRVFEDEGSTANCLSSSIPESPPESCVARRFSAIVQIMAHVSGHVKRKVLYFVDIKISNTIYCIFRTTCTLALTCASQSGQTLAGWTAPLETPTGAALMQIEHRICTIIHISLSEPTGRRALERGGAGHSRRRAGRWDAAGDSQPRRLRSGVAAHRRCEGER